MSRSAIEKVYIHTYYMFILMHVVHVCSIVNNLVHFSFSVCRISPGDVHARMLTSLTRVEVRAATPVLRVWDGEGSV